MPGGGGPPSTSTFHSGHFSLNYCLWTFLGSSLFFVYGVKGVVSYYGALL